MMVKKHCTECMQIAIKNEYLYIQKLLLMALGMSMDYIKVLFSKTRPCQCISLVLTYFKLNGLLFF